jgi:excisionase family DNA binding protein
VKTASAQPLLDVRETARFLNVSVRTIYLLVSRDELPHVRIGGQLRFVPSVLDAWLTGGQRDEPEAA